MTCQELYIRNCVSHTPYIRSGPCTGDLAVNLIRPGLLVRVPFFSLMESLLFHL